MCDPSSCAEHCSRRGGGAKHPCVCDDDADRLAALMAAGIPQRRASLMLWAPNLLRNER